MKNSWKKTAAFLLALTIVSAPAVMQKNGLIKSDTAIVANAANIIDNGNFGDLYWTLDDEGVLFIKGEGEIPQNAFWNGANVFSLMTEKSI